MSSRTWKGRAKRGAKIKSKPTEVDGIKFRGKWVIECKGYANERFPLKWKMFMDLLNKTDDPPVLFVPRNQGQNITTVQAILELTAPTVL